MKRKARTSWQVSVLLVADAGTFLWMQQECNENLVGIIFSQEDKNHRREEDGIGKCQNYDANTLLKYLIVLKSFCVNISASFIFLHYTYKVIKIITRITYRYINLLFHIFK